jgi:hypothetical protein
LREHQRELACPRAASPSREICSGCATLVVAHSRACPHFPLRRSMVRRGSTVRVRALQEKTCKAGLSSSTESTRRSRVRFRSDSTTIGVRSGRCFCRGRIRFQRTSYRPGALCQSICGSPHGRSRSAPARRGAARLPKLYSRPARTAISGETASTGTQQIAPEPLTERRATT